MKKRICGVSFYDFGLLGPYTHRIWETVINKGDEIGFRIKLKINA